MNCKLLALNGINLRLELAILGLAMSSHVLAQDAATEQKLLGSWLVSGSPFQETLTFKGSNELLITTVQTKRVGKPIEPITHTSEAVYKFGAAACTVGQESGNLFLARQSDRCCFKIYQIGLTFVFDQIRSGSALSLGSDICQSKTLRRAAK